MNQPLVRQRNLINESTFGKANVPGPNPNLGLDYII
jgi:hypothetical protein